VCSSRSRWARPTTIAPSLLSFPFRPSYSSFQTPLSSLKKARSSVFPPRSPENLNHDCRPAFALFPPTLPSPVLSFLPPLFASGHSTPYTYYPFLHTQVQPAFLSAPPLLYVSTSSSLDRFVFDRPPRWRRARSRTATRRGHGSRFRFSYQPLAGFECKSPIFVTQRPLKCICSSSTSRRYRPFSFRTSS